MTSLTYRLPAELEKRLNASRVDFVQPPASDFVHDGKLNMGPAILLAVALSVGCWALIITIGARFF